MSWKNHIGQVRGAMQPSAKKARGTVMHRLLLAWKSHQNEGLCNWWGHKFMPVHIIVKTCQTWAFQSWFRWEKQPNYKVSQSCRVPKHGRWPPLFWRTKYIIVAVCWWISVQLDEFPHWIFFDADISLDLLDVSSGVKPSPTEIRNLCERWGGSLRISARNSISPSRSRNPEIQRLHDIWGLLGSPPVHHGRHLSNLCQGATMGPAQGNDDEADGGLLIKTYVDC